MNQLQPDSHQLDDARASALAAVAGLLVFAALIGIIRWSGWLTFALGPTMVPVILLAVMNLGLAQTTAYWARWRWSVWAYVGFHAVVFTVILYFFGGTSRSLFLTVYAFLVLHTQALRPGASTFPTANWCAFCVTTLAAMEHFGIVIPPPVVAAPVTSGHHLSVATFAFAAFNVLAFYTDRHGARMRELASRLEALRAARRAEHVVLAETTAALRATRHELRSLVSTVTHDLKNPFNGILLTADLARRRLPASDPATRTDLDWIAHTAEHGEHMLLDLSDFFRIASSPEESTLTPIDALVAEAVASLQPQVLERGITVRQGTLPPVWVQPRKFRHALEHLIRNAIKYSPRDTGNVEIRGRISATGVHIDVTDNGIGIDPIYHDRIFELFVRVPIGTEADPHRAPTGTGVGLALVKRIVEEHRGTIQVTSSLGAGACFSIFLPTPNRAGPER